jgi:hypothetical protein
MTHKKVILRMPKVIESLVPGVVEQNQLRIADWNIGLAMCSKSEVK